MRSIRTVAAIATVAVLAVVLAACGSSSKTSSGGSGSSSSSSISTGGYQSPTTQSLTGGKKGGTLQVLDETDFEHIDPGIAYYSLDYEVVFATQRPLYSNKPNTASEASPDMASGPPEISSDNKTVTVKLREGTFTGGNMMLLRTQFMVGQQVRIHGMPQGFDFTPLLIRVRFCDARRFINPLDRHHMGKFRIAGIEQASDRCCADG